MYKKQVREILELSNSVVRRLGSLLAFKATNADSNVRCSNHVHIICAIANCERSLLRVSMLDHIDYFCLLLWTDAASEDHISILAEVDKRRLNIWVHLDL